MDTSPEYINMCRKATELQEMWKPSQGDWFFLHDEIETVGDYSEDLHPIDYREEFPISKKTCVWLPRIDQLIELSAMHWSDIVDYARLDYNENQLSFEITLLKIVVYMVYRKRWNDEDWTCTSNTTA